MENLLVNLKFNRIEFKFYTEQSISMNFWIGAVFRNRFLYSAESIHDERGRSLRQIIDTLPLDESHFMYRQWKGGFPKGFLFDCSELPYEKPGFTLQENHVYSVNLYLIGFMSAYSAIFVEAVRKMFADGFGYPMTPLKVCEIKESEEIGIPDLSIKMPYQRVELEFLTPVSLMRPTEGNNGYQNKMNNFPSFYQFMRSMAYRMISLNILYAGDSTFTSRDEIDQFIDSYISESTDAILLNADIHFAKRYSTPKKDKNKVYVMDGYIGILEFINVPSKYLNVLILASAIGIGNDINFGMGTYRIQFYTR